jgi:hypothetical protein
MEQAKRVTRRSWCGIQFTWIEGKDGFRGHWLSATGIKLYRNYLCSSPLAPSWDITLPNGKEDCGITPEDAMKNVGLLPR